MGGSDLPADDVAAVGAACSPAGPGVRAGVRVPALADGGACPALPPAPPRPASGRILFASHLRGLAALAVAMSHLIGVYWAMPGVAAAVTVTPLQGGPLPATFALVADPRLQLGPLGVAVFFLISGFVIPVSLQRHAPGGFLLARALRIYPTYVVAQLLQMLVVAADARVWGTAFPYSAWSVAANCLLVENYLGVPSLDLVNWTLGVELKFYLLMALLAPLIGRGSVAALLGIALAAIGLNAGIGAISATRFATARFGLLTAMSYDSLYVVFMTLGVAFNYHLRGLLRTPALVALVGVLAGLFLGCWWISRLAGQFPWVPENYLYALALFALLYALRRHVPRSRVLGALAAISYPFYLLHVLLGFSLLKLLMLRAHLAYGPSLLLTLGAVGLVATALHLTVERASIRLARPLRLGRGTAAG